MGYECKIRKGEKGKGEREKGAKKGRNWLDDRVERRNPKREWSRWFLSLKWRRERKREPKENTVVTIKSVLSVKEMS